jgi:flagellin-specific chaperone FliS
VQKDIGDIGPIIDALKEIMDSWFGLSPKRDRSQNGSTLTIFF